MPFFLSLALRALEARLSWKKALVGFFQDCWVLAEFLFVANLLPPLLSFGLSLLFFSYLGFTWTLSFRYSVHSHFLKYLFSPSFSDSIRAEKKAIFPLLFLIFISSCGAFFPLPFWVPLIPGILSFFFINKRFSTENPLFSLQFLKKQRAKVNVSLTFPLEKCSPVSPNYPLLRKTEKFLGEKEFDLAIDRKNPPHVVFLFLESFRAENIGALGALHPLSPAFDALSREGILFTEFFSTGNYTSRAILASLFSIVPPKDHFPLFECLNTPLIGAADLFQQAGYRTAVLQSGHLSFENLLQFFRQNSFDTVCGKRELEEKGAESSSWGVFDEYLMQEAVEFLQSQKKPTFLSLFTITNHHPWKIPPHFSPPQETANNPYLQTFAYTDFCLKAFVQKLKQEHLFEKTLLFVLADHGQKTMKTGPLFENNEEISDQTTHIPLLILGHGVQGAQKIERKASQLDLLPTLIDLFQFPYFHHSMGRSLLRKQESQLYLQHPPAYVAELFQNKAFTPFKKRKEPSFHLECRDLLSYRENDLKERAQKKRPLFSASVKNCLFLNDRALRLFFQEAKELEVFTIEGSDELEGIKWPQLPRLAKFEIAHCPNLQESWIEWLKQHRSLRNLTIDCEFLEDRHLISLSETLKDLWTLEITSTKEIQGEGIDALLRANPHLVALKLVSENLGDPVFSHVEKSTLHTAYLSSKHRRFIRTCKAALQT